MQHINNQSILQNYPKTCYDNSIFDKILMNIEIVIKVCMNVALLGFLTVISGASSNHQKFICILAIGASLSNESIVLSVLRYPNLPETLFISGTSICIVEVV